MEILHLSHDNEHIYFYFERIVYTLHNTGVFLDIGHRGSYQFKDNKNSKWVWVRINL